jgi:hypothetical protein
MVVYLGILTSSCSSASSGLLGEGKGIFLGGKEISILDWENYL